MDRRDLIALILAFVILGGVGLALVFVGGRSSCERTCARKGEKAVFLGISNLRLGGGMPTCKCIAADVRSNAN